MIRHIVEEEKRSYVECWFSRSVGAMMMKEQIKFSENGIKPEEPTQPFSSGYFYRSPPICVTLRCLCLFMILLFCSIVNSLFYLIFLFSRYLRNLNDMLLRQSDNTRMKMSIFCCLLTRQRLKWLSKSSPHRIMNIECAFVTLMITEPAEKSTKVCLLQFQLKRILLEHWYVPTNQQNERRCIQISSAFVRVI